MRHAFPNIERPDAASLELAIVRLDALAKLMDAAFLIPGTTIRMGLAGLIGLFPVVGDVIGGAVSSYIVWEARRLGAPTWLLARMSLNVAIETGIGAIPFVGDMFDIVFRANLRNMALLRGHLERRGQIATKTIDGTFSRGPAFSRPV